MPSTTLQRQCSYLRCRIRDNVKAALSEEWDSLQKWYKPKLNLDANNKDWVDLMKEQEAVEKRIEAARLSSSPVERARIIKDLREKYPKIASQVPESKPEPKQRPEPASESPKAKERTVSSLSVPPSYETVTNMAQPMLSDFPTSVQPPAPSSTGRPPTAPVGPPPAPYSVEYAPPAPVLHPGTSTIRRPLTAPVDPAPTSSTIRQPPTAPVEPPAPSTIRRPPTAPVDERPIKRAKRVEADSEDDEIPDDNTNGKDDDFNPAQERGERAAARREQKQRNEDLVTKPKNDVTEEQLLRQYEELKTKFRLDEIQIFKQIAIRKNDQQAQWNLAEEELDLKHKRDKEKMRKKILGE